MLGLTAQYSMSRPTHGLECIAPRPRFVSQDSGTLSTSLIRMSHAFWTRSRHSSNDNSGARILTPMSDSDLPSGPWTGFFTYNQLPGKWRTDLTLTFQHGQMTGEGSDSAGLFVISGRYDRVSKEC